MGAQRFFDEIYVHQFPLIELSAEQTAAVASATARVQRVLPGFSAAQVQLRQAPLFVRFLVLGVVNLSVAVFDGAAVAAAELQPGDPDNAALTVHVKLCTELMTMLGVSPLRAARNLAVPL